MKEGSELKKGIQIVGMAGAGIAAVAGAILSTVAPAFAYDYANTFAPVSTDLQAALTAVVPIALGIFVIVLAIRLGSRLVKNFVR